MKCINCGKESSQFRPDKNRQCICFFLPVYGLGSADASPVDNTTVNICGRDKYSL